MTSQSITYPLDSARAKMAVTNKDHSQNLYQIFKKVKKSEGISSFYRGLLPTMIGIIPYGGVSFSINEMLKKYWVKKYQKQPNYVDS